MLIKRFFLMCTLPAFMAGCSPFYGSQPPAPVYGGGTTVYSKAKPPVHPMCNPRCKHELSQFLKISVGKNIRQELLNENFSKVDL